MGTTAINIARYVINKCISLGRPISNLQLQKILYYIQGAFIKSTNGQLLFNEDIEAWQYGPVVPVVYYMYNNYSASTIRDLQSVNELDIGISEIIDPVIETKSRISVWNLVTRSHLEDPWRNSYIGGQKRVIPVEELQKFFNR